VDLLQVECVIGPIGSMPAAIADLTTLRRWVSVRYCEEYANVRGISIRVAIRN